jgi:ribonuclease BN (tRNA processing enzyme)
MQIIFLGTNGWYSDLNNTICTLIDSEKFYIILDAGDGLFKLSNFIKTEKPILMFLTHTHLDHIIGLHILNKFRFKQGITIYGYEGTKKSLDAIIRHPFTSPFSDIPFKVEIHDFEEGIHKNPLPFISKKLLHSDDCVGYRFEIENKIISFCTDTGVCDNIYLLSQNADLLISECSYKQGQEKWGWPHLKPEEIALIAKETKVKQLILTHFDASIFLTMENRKRALKKAKQIFESTIIAYDEFKFSL